MLTTNSRLSVSSPLGRQIFPADPLPDYVPGACGTSALHLHSGTGDMAAAQKHMGRELEGLSILVVEDETVIALDTAFTIEAAGGAVVGPAHSVDEAFERMAGGHIDAALLDINLRNQKVFGLADALADRNVPIVFVTGEIWPTIPERHAACRRVGKPIAHANVIRSLLDATGAAQSNGNDTAGPLAPDR